MKKHLILLLMFLLTSCTLFTGGSEIPDVEADESNANMPNPAAVYCEENGGRVEIRKDEEGNEYGFCLFPDGSE